MPRSDAELMLACKGGDRGAFTELVLRHQRPLLNFFFHLVWDRQQAEDLAQEVFLRLHSHASTYEPQAKFTTFMYRVARNLWIDRVRSAAVSPRPASLDAATDDRGEDSLGSRVSIREPGPLEKLERIELQNRVREAIEKLPDGLREVVVLGELHGLPYLEISSILNIPVGTVKSRMHAAVARLRELMGVEAGVPGLPARPAQAGKPAPPAKD
ncbi:MAG: sigma-70 family RNA polymerase sigma factor [Planctomycetes bacterium]|nr:sigma-70 family RNA polymerase sigma factor [Planctomycetota bacterium]